MAVPALHAPNAALLIDFDNVTLGVRSDLTKELRTLLNSDIIKGKVAVQRAYADWRRYPQYIVPLSESSIDLIFAPAFGTNKKNATDIRLAVDAVELVFTRPEIGTFILLSGDSDFSSLVLKLKEYGKYVIGVGIRESASDILIQNCDEYFSYSDLAGLTKESDAPSAQRDPWELVVEAVQKMAAQGDVMRSDRLKQVMQQLDPNFDESNAGFNRFSKFVTEAGARGLIQVIKQENGQYDVAPGKGVPGRAGEGEPPAARSRRTWSGDGSGRYAGACGTRRRGRTGRWQVRRRAGWASSRSGSWTRAREG
ncbi:MAG: NYN domain-containing protein [Gemmatimonadetes bacterium]|nr:NYN domain-containing protein [Gemmatimonadota bacterium]